MHTSKKFAAVAASVAVMAPVGIAQATHDTGRAGAPGQVCKPLHPNSQPAREARRTFQNSDPAPTRAAVRNFRRMQQAGYRACVRAAAEMRSHEDGGENTASQ